MQETQNNELFSDISTEESAAINGGHGCGCYGYSRSVNYYGRPVRYGSGYRGYSSVSYEYSYPSYRYYRGGCY